MERILSVQNIHKSFINNYKGFSGNDEIELSEVLKGITFDVYEGGLTAIIGTNGSGKSTLFNIISGLIKPKEGQIKYYYKEDEYDLSKISEFQHARLGIGRLFQGNNIFNNLSVIENLMIADNNRLGELPWQIFKNIKYSEKIRKEKAENILISLLGENNPIWCKRNEFAGSLSIGQQRLLAFARMFMNENATLFLLDEPCAGVNLDIREIMVNMINQLKQQNKTIVLIEHNLDFVKRVANNAVYLQDGKVNQKGTIFEVMENKELINNYLGLSKNLG